MEVGISYSNFTFTVQFELIYVVELEALIIVDGFWLTAMVTAVFKWQVKCHDR